MMRRNHVEHIKSGLLVILVLISFVFSGYLWYSTPASEVLKPDNDVPPYIFKSPLYSSRERHELIAPFQIVTHQAGTSMIFPDESRSYKDIEKTTHQLEISRFEEIRPTKKEWIMLSKSVGVELLFLHDISYEWVESFFGRTIPFQRTSEKANHISRMWIFRDPFTQKARVWLIFEKEKKVAEGFTQMNRDALEELISNATKTNAHPITPIALHGSLPWETTSASLSRIFYFPTTPLRLKQLSFQVENINIDNMKQWLFRDPEIKPLIPNADESFYMYNDQLLNFNVKHNYMTYNDSTSGENEESLSLSNQLDSIKNFVQRHQGWTGLYLLDEIQKDDLYLFRLFKQGYPVFWPNGDASHGIYPDLIQLQTGDNGVNKYTRSMYFLSGKPTELKEIVLPGKESLLTTLKQKGIPLNHVERIFPGYVAEETITNKRKQIQLNPVWVIHKTDGKKEFVN